MLDTATNVVPCAPGIGAARRTGGATAGARGAPRWGNEIRNLVFQSDIQRKAYNHPRTSRPESGKVGISIRSAPTRIEVHNRVSHVLDHVFRFRSLPLLPGVDAAIQRNRHAAGVGDGGAPGAFRKKRRALAGRNAQRTGHEQREGSISSHMVDYVTRVLK